MEIVIDILFILFIPAVLTGAKLIDDAKINEEKHFGKGDEVNII